MYKSGQGTYPVLKDEDEGEKVPLIYQPSTYQPSAPPFPVTTDTTRSDVVELQPIGGQLPITVQVIQKPQANDHLGLTVALMVLCFFCPFTLFGTLMLIPALLCAAMGADYNKAGETDKARSCGRAAFIYDVAIIILQIIGYILATIAIIVVVTVTSTRHRNN